MDRARPLTVEACFDRSLINEDGGSVNYLVVRIEAPERLDRNKQPLNLAIVIDVSDSMGGKPLECAKQAAIGVVNALTDRDRLSLVTFANVSEVHFERLTLDRNGKQNAAKAISRLGVRGNTNLFEGWKDGALCVAKFMEKSSGYQNHVLLLSDGYANVGLRDPQSISRHAMELQMRGITTSTVGIGDGYSPSQIRMLAEYGGGRMHDAQYPGEIVEVVLAHLRELNDTVLENLTLGLEFPNLKGIESVSEFPTELADSRLISLCGSLLSKGERCAVYRIKSPSQESVDELQFQVHVSYKWVGQSESLVRPPVTVSLRFVKESRYENQSRDFALSLLVAQTWQASVVSRVVDLNRDKQHAQSIKFLDEQLEQFIPYCDGLPGAENLCGQMLQLKRIAAKEWDERARKEMQYSTHTRTYSHVDTRNLERQHWSKLLPNQ